jgi:hypothetical protein
MNSDESSLLHLMPLQKDKENQTWEARIIYTKITLTLYFEGVITLGKENYTTWKRLSGPTKHVREFRIDINLRLTMASNAQKLSAAAEFIKDAPPGEMTEVLAGEDPPVPF